MNVYFCLQLRLEFVDLTGFAGACMVRVVSDPNVLAIPSAIDKTVDIRSADAAGYRNGR